MAKLLVLSGVHPREAHASAIWKALKSEIDDPNVIFDKVPFKMTGKYQLIKFFKILHENDGVLERRLQKFESMSDDPLVVEKARRIVDILYRDIRSHKPWYKANVARIVGNWIRYNDDLIDEFQKTVLPEIVHPLYEENTSIYRKFLSKYNVHLCIDLHNSERLHCKSWKPSIVECPKNADINLKQIIRRYPDEKLSPWFKETNLPEEIDLPIIGVEIPARFIGGKFGTYAAFGQPQWYFGNVKYAAPYHPDNRRYFTEQKEIVKDIILEIAKI